MSFEIHLSGHVKHIVDETLPGLVADLIAFCLRSVTEETV